MPRQKEFDPDEALEKAMRFFWKNGYRNTSIRDLINSTGVNFYGLYNVFGDKRGVYLKGLDKYMSSYVKRIKESTEGALKLEAALKGAFTEVLKIVTAENQNAGCMACNAAVEVAPIDEEVARRIQLHRTTLERFFIELQQRFEMPEISAEQVKARAEYLCSQIYTIGMLVRSQCSQAVLQRHVKTTVQLMK